MAAPVCDAAAPKWQLKEPSIGQARSEEIRSTRAFVQRGPGRHLTRFFNGTAASVRLVANGISLQTSETLPQAQNRMMGSASYAACHLTAPGPIELAARSLRVTRHATLAVNGENQNDRNYRSSADAPGANLQA